MIRPMIVSTRDPRWIASTQVREAPAGRSWRGTGSARGRSGMRDPIGSTTLIGRRFSTVSGPSHTVAAPVP